MKLELTCPSHEIVQRYNDRSDKSVTANFIIGSDRGREETVTGYSTVVDDEEDWEDQLSEEEGSTNQFLFQKVSSTAHLLSPSSSLTQGLINSDAGKSFGNTAPTLSASAITYDKTISSDRSSSFAVLPEVRGKDRNRKSIMLRTRALDRDDHNLPAKTQTTYSTASSPRTVKREMLSTELTDELRYQLWWERQQMSISWQAVLAREARYRTNTQRAVQQESMQNPSPAMPTHNGGESIWSSDSFCFSNDYHTRGW